MNYPKILFWLNNSRGGEGMAVIYCRITYGTTAKYSTGISVDPRQWDNLRKKLKGRDMISFQHNKELVLLESELLQSYDRLKMIKKKFNAQDIVNEYKSHYFSDISDLEWEQLVKIHRKGSELSESTWSAYISLFKYFNMFLEEWGITNLLVSKINKGLINRFEVYLRRLEHVGIPLMPSTRKLYLDKICRIMSFAKENELIRENVIEGIRFPSLEKEMLSLQYVERSLSENDLLKFDNANVPEDLEKYRLYFLWQSWTGMSWADISKKDNYTIEKNVNGSDFLSYERQKTGVKATIPLFPEVKDLVYKIKSVSLGSYSDYINKLKTLASIYGIERNISSHDGRHSFGVRMLLKGFSIASISKMLGHSTVAETEKDYIKVDLNKIYKDMVKLNVA